MKSYTSLSIYTVYDVVNWWISRPKMMFSLDGFKWRTTEMLTIHFINISYLKKNFVFQFQWCHRIIARYAKFIIMKRAHQQVRGSKISAGRRLCGMDYSRISVVNDPGTSIGAVASIATLIYWCILVSDFLCY